MCFEHLDLINFFDLALARQSTMVIKQDITIVLLHFAHCFGMLYFYLQPQYE